MTGTPLDKNTIKPIFSKKYQEKRSSRVLAVQAFYAYTYENEIELDMVILNLINDSKAAESLDNFSKSDEKLLINLVRGAYLGKDQLQQSISKHISKEWRFDRLPKVIQSILIIATFEIMSGKFDNPLLINEYIEIAKMFNHDGESGFVNKVLDNIAKDL